MKVKSKATFCWMWCSIWQSAGVNTWSDVLNRNSSLSVFLQCAQMCLSHTWNWEFLADVFFTTKHDSNRIYCNWFSKEKARVLQKSSITRNKQQLWKQYFHIMTVEVWTDSVPQQYVAHGYQTWQVNKILQYHPKEHNQEVIEKCRPNRMLR